METLESSHRKTLLSFYQVFNNLINSDFLKKWEITERTAVLGYLFQTASLTPFISCLLDCLSILSIHLYYYRTSIYPYTLCHVCTCSVFIQIAWDWVSLFTLPLFFSILCLNFHHVNTYILNGSFLGPVCYAPGGVHHSLSNEQLGLCPAFPWHKQECAAVRVLTHVLGFLWTSTHLNVQMFVSYLQLYQVDVLLLSRVSV